MMTASGHEEAVEVLRSSCLQRRRRSAAYKLDPAANRLDYFRIGVLIAGIFVLALLLAGLTRNSGQAVAVAAQDPPDPSGMFERYCFRRFIRPGDTMSGIAQEFYGRGNPENIRDLLNANPRIKDADMIDKADYIMVPLRENGCKIGADNEKQ